MEVEAPLIERLPEGETICLVGHKGKNKEIIDVLSDCDFKRWHEGEKRRLLLEVKEKIMKEMANQGMIDEDEIESIFNEYL